MSEPTAPGPGRSPCCRRAQRRSRGRTTWTRRSRSSSRPGRPRRGGHRRAILQDPTARAGAAADARDVRRPARGYETRWPEPRPPVHRAALDRTGSLGGRGGRPTGHDDRRGPAARGRGRRRRGVRRRADVRLVGRARGRHGRGGAAGRDRRPRGRGDRDVPASSMATRARRVAGARGPDRPADGPRERPDPRAGARARGGPGAAAGDRGLGRPVRRRRVPRAQRVGRARGRRPGPAPGRGRPRANVRLVDTLGRTGGDEFVLVAPGSAGVTVARRVLDGIARLEAVDGHPVTVSAGVARFPQDGAGRRVAARGGAGRVAATGARRHRRGGGRTHA